MRLSALLLVLLPLFSCEESTVLIEVQVAKTRCSAGTPDKTAALNKVLNGECSYVKDAVNQCCIGYSKCVSPDGSNVKIPGSKYALCGIEQARCIDNTKNTKPVCQKYLNYININALSKGVPGRDFALLPELGVDKELYGNCTASKSQIDACVRVLKDCVGKRKKRGKEAEADREPFFCEEQGRNCLELVIDIDRTNPCAREVGYAIGVMGRGESATKEEEDKVSSPNPFTSVMDHMQKQWNISWWASLALILTATLCVTCCCCCLTYCCAMAGARKQENQRRWEKQQERKERGADRYSTVESAGPSSVRVSQYSVEDETTEN